MAMNYKEFGAPYADKYPGVRKMNEHADFLKKAGELPERFPEAQAPQTQAQVEAAPRIEIKPPLAKAITAWKETESHTPELVTSFNRALWEQIGEITGINVRVPEFPGSEQQIKEMEEKGKGIIFLPEEYATQAQRHLIGTAFKLIDNQYVPNNWSMQPDNPVKNDNIHIGYRFVDMQIESRNLKTNEKQARDLTGKGNKEEGAEGMNLSEYVLAGLYSKLLKGQYLDEPSWSRLLSSSHDARVVDANFAPHGYFRVHSSLRPGARGDALGARFSSGVNSASEI